MWWSRTTRSIVALGLVVPAIAGCAAVVGTSSGGSCVAPSGEVPATVAPGDTVTIPLAHLWDSNDCRDTGVFGATPPPRAALSEVIVQLRGPGPCPPDAPLVASATAKVNSDADLTATVHLAVPTDAHGLYWVVLPGFGGYPVGGMNVGFDPTASATNVGFFMAGCTTRA
jgi:hypothetical protein